jgi:uncharacterized protein YraI
MILIFSSCGLNVSSSEISTPKPDFVTSTLPTAPIPPPTQTPIHVVSTAIAVETVVLSTVEGTTTTQLNVRTEPSTASETLGIINQFTSVQVIGSDASASWYQILYPDSAAGKGWVRAEFVQVNSIVEIPVIGSAAGSGSGVSGLVIEKINVRKGPGTDFELLDVLNPKDVVFITGRDSSGEWLQIEFASSPEGIGWVTSKFLQVDNAELVPVIGTAEQATEAPSPPVIAAKLAAQDGDTLQAPLAVTVFSASGPRALQVNDDISAPDGDTEDWIQFTPFGESVLVEAGCATSGFQVDLWNEGQYENAMALACGGKHIIKTRPNQPYYLRVQANKNDDLQYIRYILKISTLE